MVDVQRNPITIHIYYFIDFQLSFLLQANLNNTHRVLKKMCSAIQRAKIGSGQQDGSECATQQVWFWLISCEMFWSNFYFSFRRKSGAGVSFWTKFLACSRTWFTKHFVYHLHVPNTNPNRFPVWHMQGCLKFTCEITLDELFQRDSVSNANSVPIQISQRKYCLAVLLLFNRRYLI